MEFSVTATLRISPSEAAMIRTLCDHGERAHATMFVVRKMEGLSLPDAQEVVTQVLDAEKAEA